MAKWVEALQSWSTFCAIQPDAIFTVPSGLIFDLNKFLSKMCTLDIMELVEEFTEYQGIDKFIEMVSRFLYSRLLQFL